MSRNFGHQDYPRYSDEEIFWKSNMTVRIVGCTKEMIYIESR